MNRKIFNTISFSKGLIHFSSIEKINSNKIEIFNKKNDIKNAKNFLLSSVKEIEKNLNIKIKNVSIVLEPSKKVNSKIKLDYSGIKIIDNIVSKKDLDNLLKIVEKKFNNKKEKVILIHPFEFEVKDLITKKYSKAPYFKKGNELKIKSIITTINIKVYEYIDFLIKSCNLKINQILISDYAISLSKLSNNAIWNGSILIDIQKNNVNLTINKFNGTFSSLTINDFGFNNLIIGIKKYFNCSYNQSINLLKIYGNLNEKNKKIIFSENIDLKNKTFTNYDLNKIIEIYFQKLNFLIKKYLSQKNILKLPIIFAGKLFENPWKINKLKKTFETKEIFLYKPTTFIEKNEENMNNIGLIKFFEIRQKLLEIKIDEIVNTNTKSIETIFNKKKNRNTIFDKILSKIGIDDAWK